MRGDPELYGHRSIESLVATMSDRQKQALVLGEYHTLVGTPLVQQEWAITRLGRRALEVIEREYLNGPTPPPRTRERSE